jgi:hypothetical protein
VDVYLDIEAEDKHCACGHDVVSIGEETSERLVMIPTQVYAERIYKKIGLQELAAKSAIRPFGSSADKYEFARRRTGTALNRDHRRDTCIFFPGMVL